jgi:predicted acylesterase/phospholipase RssA
MFQGIAFEGGGMAGNGHIGAYKKLIGSGFKNLKGFVGSSAGSIVAALVSVRASPEWMETKMMNTDFSEFMDSSWNPLDNAKRVIQSYGWYKGDVFESWMAGCMQELTGKHDITFNEIYIRFGSTLIITKVDVLYPRCKLVVMDRNTTPDEPVYKAVRASCSIPYLFQAVLGTDGSSSMMNHVFVDGGILLNYPIELLYKYFSATDCIGVRLISISAANPGLVPADTIIVSEPITERPIQDHMEFIMSIATTVREMSMQTKPVDANRTCSVFVNVGTTDFNATKQQLQSDITNGYTAMSKFLSMHMPN